MLQQLMCWHKSQQKQMQSMKFVIWKTLYNNPAQQRRCQTWQFCVKHYHTPKICIIKPKKQILTMTIWIFELPTWNNINYQVSPQYHKITWINNGIISNTRSRPFLQPTYLPQAMWKSQNRLGMSGRRTIPQEAGVLGAYFDIQAPANPSEGTTHLKE